MKDDAMPRLVVGISGASGAILGLRVLELLHDHVAAEVHLVISNAARQTLMLEIGEGAFEKAQALAAVTHDIDNIAAPIASGSFRTAGMIVAPCSMHSLAAIAYSISDNLLTRAADVTLKERRRLVLLAREAPLHAAHLEAMSRVTTLGAIVLPPVPAFYARPQTLDEAVTQIAARAIELAGLDPGNALVRWNGSEPSRHEPAQGVT
jgi:flavin prenyltransferase